MWFDAHLDLAYLAVNGRDLARPLSDLDRPEHARAAGPHPPAAVTFPALADGGVKLALGTIYTEPIRNAAPASPEQYPSADADRAGVVGRAQLEAYLTWRDRGLITLDLRAMLRDDPHVGEIRGGMGVSEPRPWPLSRKLAGLRRDPRLHVGILIEGADPIRSPDELVWWRERGVVAVGLTWARSSRYATGNADAAGHDAGLTDLGRAIIPELDRHRIAHDLSHLSQRATDELLSLTTRAVMASHSNCRRLLGGDSHPSRHRHLSDAVIAEIARRGGMIGLNLFAPFLRNDLPPGHRPTIDDALAHVEHICAVAGSRAVIGLGSDMDGGFGAMGMCRGVERPQHLPRLLAALAHRGWSDDDLEGFAWRNWAAYLDRMINARA